MLTTHGTGTLADAKYFQWGYPTDWVREAGTALGQVGIAVDTRLEFALADLGYILGNIVQIAGTSPCP